MGVNNHLALRNSRLIRDYSLIDDRLRQLAYFVKYWARRRKINDPYRGTLSSYCYVLMLINFLQVQKYVRYIHMTATLLPYHNISDQTIYAAILLQMISDSDNNGLCVIYLGHQCYHVYNQLDVDH
jgi:DNA polymerase sigma